MPRPFFAILVVFLGSVFLVSKMNAQESAMRSQAERTTVRPAAVTPVTIPASISQKLLHWFTPICLLIWLTAAFLHWRRNRHWSLLTISIALLLAILGMSMPYVAMTACSSSGSFETVKIVIVLSNWVQLCALFVGFVGGVGAIQWTLNEKSGRP